MKPNIFQSSILNATLATAVAVLVSCQSANKAQIDEGASLKGTRGDVREALKQCGRRNSSCVAGYYQRWIQNARDDASNKALRPEDIAEMKRACPVFGNFAQDRGLNEQCLNDLEELRRGAISDSQSQIEDQQRQPGGDLAMFQDHRSGSFGPNFFGSQILMLVVGGWNSCVTGDHEGPSSFMGRAGMESPWDGRTTKGFRDFYQKMNINSPRTKINFMLVCLQTGPADAAQMRFITSDKLAVLHQTKDGRTPYRSEDFPEVVSQYFPDVSIPTYVVGHSYGGWVVMNYIRDIINQRRDVRGLFTLDPISSLQCLPLAQILKSPACTVAPGSISSSRDIPNQVIINSLPPNAYWHNFFQNNGGLHSSAIRELVRSDKGQNIDQTNIFDQTATAVEAAHRHMGSRSENWDVIFDRVVGSM